MSGDRNCVSISKKKEDDIMSAAVVDKSKRHKEYLPFKNSDSKRMNAMYIDFRPKEVNPEGWESKMKNWLNSITQWSQETNTPEFTIQDFRIAFEVDNTRPTLNCAKLIFSHMCRENNLMLKKDFIEKFSRKTDDSWMKWGFNAIAKPVSFGLNFIKSGDEADSEKMDDNVQENVEFINFVTIKHLAECLVTHMQNMVGGSDCMVMDIFEEMIREKFFLNKDQLAYCILYLEYEKKVRILFDNGIKIIKFGSKPLISELELGIIRLDYAKGLIEADIKRVESAVDVCKTEARECVREGNRLKAKILLKRKKRLEDQFDKKESQLDNVQFLLEQLQDSGSHKLVMNAYQQCSDALKMAQINVEDVDNSILDIESVLSQQTDLVADISRSINPSIDIDNDIEKELEDMLSEEKSEIKLKIKDEKIIEDSADDHLNDLLDRLQKLKAPIETQDVTKPSKLKN